MTLLSDRGRALRESQVSARAPLPLAGLLHGKTILWLLFLFSAGLITLAQANIDPDEATKLLDRGYIYNTGYVKFINANYVPYVAPGDVRKYEAQLEEKVAKIEKLVEIFEPMSTAIRANGKKFSVAQWKSVESVYEKLATAIQETRRLELVIKSRGNIHKLSEIGDEWNGIQGNLTDEKKKQDFQDKLDNANADLEDFSNLLAAIETEPTSSLMDYEASSDDFEKNYLKKFQSKVLPLGVSLADLKRELAKSGDGSQGGHVGGSGGNGATNGTGATGGTGSSGRSWYMKKRWWIPGLILTATALGGGATYGLSPDFREWVNSIIGRSNSNQVATTTSFGSNLSSTTTLAPESSSSNGLVWIIIVVLLALAGGAFYFFWSGRKQTSTGSVPKADDDKSGSKSKKGNSAATGTTPASTSSATSGGTSGAQVNSK